jgi:WD40 repeat protein
LEEIINPISLKLDDIDLNLYCGLNRQIIKVDLISDKIEYKKISGESSPISCIDINQKNNYYISGSYSGKIYLIDKKSNQPFHIIQEKHPRGVNYVKFLKSGENFITGGRKDSEILLWDCRKLNSPIFSFYRKNETNQKLSICLDSGFTETERYLYAANSDGTVIIYDLLNLSPISYYYANENFETVNSLDLINFQCNLGGEKNYLKFLVTGTGTRHYVLNEKSLEENVEEYKHEFDRYFKSSFRLWDISQLYK